MRFSLLVVAAGLLLLPLAARADLLGDTVHVTYDFPTSTATYIDVGDFVVPATGTVSAPTFTIATFALAPNQISVTDAVQQSFTASTFNGLEFTDISRDPSITNVTIDPLSTLAAGQITFTSDSVFLNLQGIGTVNPGQTIILDLSFAPASAVTPEPSSIALLGTGLLGVAGTMRRRLARS